MQKLFPLTKVRGKAEAIQGQCIASDFSQTKGVSMNCTGINPGANCLPMSIVEGSTRPEAKQNPEVLEHTMIRSRTQTIPS